MDESGGALKVYLRISEDAAKDYDKVKIALISPKMAIVVNLRHPNRKLTSRLRG